MLLSFTVLHGGAPDELLAKNVHPLVNAIINSYKFQLPLD